MHGLDQNYSEIVEKLGRVTGHFANTLDVVFPDELKRRRELLQDTLKRTVVKNAPASDPGFALSDLDVTDLLDWAERARFLKLHVSVNAILGSQFKGTALDHTTLAKEVESLSATFEHMTNLLLAEANKTPNGSTLKPKLTKYWDNDPVVQGILESDWNFTRTNPPATLAGQLAALANFNAGPRGEIAKTMLTAVLYRNAGLHSGMDMLEEADLHGATRIFLLAMMYLRKNLLHQGNNAAGRQRNGVDRR